MTQIKYIIRVILLGLVLLFGVMSIAENFQGIRHGIFDLTYVPTVFLFAFLVISIVVDTHYFKKNRRIYEYVSSFVCIMFCGVVAILYMRHKLIDNAETVLKVSHKPGAANVLSIEFKKNNKFRLTECDMFGSTIYYGSYRKTGDTIEIISTNCTESYSQKLNTGIIRDSLLCWKDFDTLMVDRLSDVIPKPVNN